MTESLLSWFYARRRDLPWRRERTPYRVWISEVMLQQTRASTVAPYFERWMARFPDICSLAEASLDDVLKLWEGLGYYRRARLLHEAARVVVREHRGELPATRDELLKLPGIGAYSAAAVASLAFGEPVLAVDGNVRRVAARLFALPGAVATREVHDRLGPLLPAGAAGDFNEALMELGATVCTPVSPSCGSCPVRLDCRAFATGRVGEFPNPRPKRAVPSIERLALIHTREGRLWLERRPAGGMLGGLWGFPLSEVGQPGDVRLAGVRHAYTHFKITATPTLRRGDPAAVNDSAVRGDFFDLEQIHALALSRLDHKILAGYLAARSPRPGLPETGIRAA